MAWHWRGIKAFIICTIDGLIHWGICIYIYTCIYASLDLDEFWPNGYCHLPHLSTLLTHWGWVMHICISNLTIIGSDNGLLPGWLQAIIWNNAEILLIRPLGTNFSEILIKIHTFSFNKINFKMSYAKWWPFCLSLNVLRYHFENYFSLTSLYVS